MLLSGKNATSVLLNIKTITKCACRGVPFAPGEGVIMLRKHKPKREVTTSQDEKKQASTGRSFMNEGQ